MPNVSPASHRTKAKTGKGKITAKSESQVAAEENNQRITLYLSNSGEEDAWAALEKTAVSGEGIFLAKKVGTAVISDYSGPVGVITPTGTTNIGIAEV